MAINSPILIMKEHGRLGNQLFQVSLLYSQFQSSIIILVGFRDLSDYLDLRKYPRLIFCKNRFSIAIINNIIRLLLQLKLLNQISEDRKSNSLRVVREGSKYAFATVVDGFFQSISFLSPHHHMVPRSPLLQHVTHWLVNAKIDSKYNLYFVHIRRGDYLKPETFGFEKSSSVPLDWFFRRMDEIRIMNKQAHFLIFSDDPRYVRKAFHGTSDCFYTLNDPSLDLILMQNCLGGGILSPSSYSLWAAYNIKITNNNALLVAPKFWVGWPGNDWYPQNISMSWLTYRDVAS